MTQIQIKTMTRMAISLALIIIVEMLESSFLRMPQGGSISLSSLMFLLVIPFFTWMEAGILFLAWRMLMLFFIPPFYVSLWQLALDYFIAYAGFLLVYPLSKARKGRAFIVAIILANIMRYIVHVVTGTVYFGQYAQETPVLAYSVIYNLTYMGPTLILQLILGWMLLPLMRRMHKEDNI